MARKLYIVNVTGKSKAAGNTGPQWAGTLSKSYSYLGDFGARLLGINTHAAMSRVPRWLHDSTSVTRVGRGRASRLDANFRGWGW